MSVYKPRSGTFRKVKYPLKIYKTNEIPRNDVRDVLEMVEKIRAEETLDSPQYQFDEAEECKDHLQDIMKKKSPKFVRLQPRLFQMMISKKSRLFCARMLYGNGMQLHT